MTGTHVTHPDLVLVSVGANDATHVTGRDAFRARYEEALRALPKGTTTRVVLLGVPDMGSPPRLAQPLRALVGWRGRALDAEVRAVAAAAGATYVDVEGETGPAFRRHPDRYFAADRYHPSADGYALWADAVIAALGRPDRRPSPGVP